MTARFLTFGLPEAGYWPFLTMLNRLFNTAFKRNTAWVTAGQGLRLLIQVTSRRARRPGDYLPEVPRS